MLRLEAIHFNHNPNSATGDALNIRLNHLPGTVVQDPEWRHGYDSLPVAYAREQVTQRVTIKARLHGPPNSTFRVRARDAADITRSKTGLVKWLALLIGRLLGLDYGGVLGEIAESVVSFGADGDSGWIELEAQRCRIKRAGVGIYQVCWLWQCVASGNWQPFAESEHRIYVVLDQPQEPWSPGHMGPAQEDVPLAWAEALELACDWAEGATNKNEAARLITERINSNRLLFYCAPSFFVCRDCYLLSCFIRLIKIGVSFPVNCGDCASAVATFSNLLGCQLRIGDITTAGKLETRRILLIGRNPSSISDWQVRKFGQHEVAWWPSVAEDKFVFDACLQLDLSKGAAPMPEPYLATRMRFADAESRGYRDYLLTSSYGLARDGFVRDIR